MKPGVFIALLLVSALAAGSAAAQPAPFNATGVTFGHWHLASTPANVEANKKIFFAIGGRLFMPGGGTVMMVPGTYISLTRKSGPGRGETVGSVVNRVGFAV